MAPYITPGYTAGDVAAAGVIGFGAGIAVGALANDWWGWNSWNCDWHGGYYNGGYHDGYGYHNAYNRTATNNFRGSA
jgi:hypothetical protein